MIATELLDWFPQAQIVEQPVDKEGFLTLPVSSQQWMLLEVLVNVKDTWWLS